jgi:hypothetical protein
MRGIALGDAYRERVIATVVDAFIFFAATTTVRRTALFWRASDSGAPVRCVRGAIEPVEGAAHVMARLCAFHNVSNDAVQTTDERSTTVAHHELDNRTLFACGVRGFCRFV